MTPQGSMSVGFDEDFALPYTTDDDLSALTAEDVVTTPLHHVAVRYSDLDENNTRYDRLVAAPSDGEMQIMWLGWSLVTGICGAIVVFIFTALLLSPSRSKPFNVYLICLMVPDILLSVLCCWTCTENYRLHHYSSFWMCHFQSFYCMFSIAANAWMNVAVCRQLHCMLVSAGKFRRYKPPTVKQVLTEAGAVYAFSIFVASWPLWELVLPTQSWSPHKTFLVGGVECLPMDFGVASTFFFYCVFFPCLMGLPVAYTFYLLFDILKNNRLPPKGKRRQLVIYFFRLVLVFVIMWVPALVFLFITGQWLNPWVKWVGGTWCHIQGAASAIACLWKPDVSRAVLELLQCRVWRYYRCCRKYYIGDKAAADIRDFSSGLGFRRSGMRRNSSFSNFSWGNLSFLGRGREQNPTTMTMNSSDGLSIGGSRNSVFAPFGSNAISNNSSGRHSLGNSSNSGFAPFRSKVLSNDSSTKDHCRGRESVPADFGSNTSLTLLDLGQDVEEHEELGGLKEDQYADDASAHLEDEYNLAGLQEPRDLDRSMILLEEQRPSRRTALVPQMIDTSSNDSQDAEESVGLSLDEDEDMEQPTLSLGEFTLSIQGQEDQQQRADAVCSLQDKNKVALHKESGDRNDRSAILLSQQRPSRRAALVPETIDTASRCSKGSEEADEACTVELSKDEEQEQSNLNPEAMSVSHASRDQQELALAADEIIDEDEVALSQELQELMNKHEAALSQELQDIEDITTLSTG